MKKALTVSINQPAYLPWLGYFDRIAKSDLHIVLDHVQFEKNSVVNRNKIKTPRGPCWLTVPVQTKGKFGKNPISGLLIDNDVPWRRKHWRGLNQNYARSSYFDVYSSFLEETYARDWEKLMDLNLHIIRWVLAEMGIKTSILFSSSFHPEKTKSDLVLELCKHVGASRYLSGPFGREYLDLKTFEREGISVEFHDYSHPVNYFQQHGTFEAGLSVVDLLLNCGKESYAIMTGHKEKIDAN